MLDIPLLVEQNNDVLIDQMYIPKLFPPFLSPPPVPDSGSTAWSEMDLKGEDCVVAVAE